MPLRLAAVAAVVVQVVAWKIIFVVAIHCWLEVVVAAVDLVLAVEPAKDLDTELVVADKAEQHYRESYHYY